MSPYTVLADDYFISCDTTGAGGPAPITVLLPDAPTLYDQFVIKDRTGGSTTNTISVTTVSGAVLIDGATTQTFVDDYESLELIYSGVYESF